MRLAILDADAARCTSMAAILRDAGHGCFEFHAVDTMQQALRRERFDLVLIDGDIPGTPATDLLNWIGEYVPVRPPVIVLQGEGRAAGCKSAIADDRLVKPVQADVLKARVDALLAYRQRAARDSQAEIYGHHAFDVMAMTVSVGGRAVEVTAKEFGLALLLFRNLSRPMSRAQIMESVWGRMPDVPTRTLDAHVSQIRTRLGLRPENGLRLSSIYSFGYRLDMIEAAQG